MVSALAGAVLFFELLAGRGREELGPGEPEERRGYYMEDATLTEMGPDGKPRIVVNAANIEQELDDDSVVLHDLRRTDQRLFFLGLARGNGPGRQRQRASDGGEHAAPPCLAQRVKGHPCHLTPIP